MQGKVAFITGGNSGIGLAAAELFARRGAHISLLSRRADKNQEAKKIIESHGVSCLTCTGDVASERQVSEALAATFGHFGALHFAFNNAGVEQPRTPFLEQTENDFYHLMDINLKGVWLCMKYQIPLLLRSGGGAIVNNSSMAGLKPCPKSELYAASKYAVIGLTKSLAKEYVAQGIRINAVCPAGVETPMIDRIFGEGKKQQAFHDRQPFGHSAKPGEIAEAVVWLCSDQASYTTGVALPQGAITG